MMMIDGIKELMLDKGILQKTGWRIDYVPSIINASKKVKINFFCCGNSFYCMVDGMIELNYFLDSNNIYQWGNLFKKNKTEKSDYDMQMITSKDIFDMKEIVMISGKFKICGAIVRNKV